MNIENQVRRVNAKLINKSDNSHTHTQLHDRSHAIDGASDHTGQGDIVTHDVSEFAVAAKGVTNGDSHDHNGGDGAAIVEAAITLADNTTNNASTSAHGFLKKLDNVATNFMNGAGNWAPPSAAQSSYWKLVEEKTIGTAVTSFDFDAVLDGDNDGGYMLDYSIVANGTNPNYSLRLNAATWAVSVQRIYINDTTIGADRGTDTGITSVATSNTGIGHLEIISSKTGYPRGVWNCHVSPVSSTIQLGIKSYFISTPANNVNITSMGILCSVASGIGVGSVFRLWKRVA